MVDIVIRPPYDTAANRDTFQRKWGPLLQWNAYAVFAAAPFERMYFYSAESSDWLGAAGFLIQLSGLAIALVARRQLGSFGTPHLATQDHQHVVQGGLYAIVRHLLYAGGLFVVPGVADHLWSASNARSHFCLSCSNAPPSHQR
jgi:protein-S-isoprenylcysteine O-methyltransferase Ste14